MAPCGSEADSANFDAFRTLMASLRPTRIWFVSNAVSAPGRPLAAQPARGATLIRPIVGRHVGGWIHGQVIDGGGNRLVVLDAAEIADRIPHWKRHAEKPLPADAPVAVEAVHPVLVARLHIRRM